MWRRRSDLGGVGPAGGGGSNHSTGHHYHLLLTDTLLPSAPLCTLSPGPGHTKTKETGSGTCRIRLRAPVMLGAVKMEGHEAPDWSGYYSEEVGHTLPALLLLSSSLQDTQTPSGSGPELNRNWFVVKVESTLRICERKFVRKLSLRRMKTVGGKDWIWKMTKVKTIQKCQHVVCFANQLIFNI